MGFAPCRVVARSCRFLQCAACISSGLNGLRLSGDHCTSFHHQAQRGDTADFSTCTCCCPVVLTRGLGISRTRSALDRRRAQTRVKRCAAFFRPDSLSHTLVQIAIRLARMNLRVPALLVLVSLHGSLSSFPQILPGCRATIIRLPVTITRASLPPATEPRRTAAQSTATGSDPERRPLQSKCPRAQRELHRTPWRRQLQLRR